MLQIKTFQLPQEEAEANQFLSKNPPTEQGAQFNNDRLYIFYDDGAPRSVAEKVQDLLTLIRASEAAKIQQEIAKNTLEYERADVNMVKNKGKYEELSAGIQACTKAIDLQDSKIGFLMKKVEDLRANTQ